MFYCFDNGGETIDRYTIVFPDGDLYGCNDRPFHPQGFGQFCGNITDPSFKGCGRTVKEFISIAKKDKRMGKPIKFADLPDDVKKLIVDIQS